MKGIAFYWEPPYRDIYSGMDCFADAWEDLGSSFELELAAITQFPIVKDSISQYLSFSDFVSDNKKSKIAIADTKPIDVSVNLDTIDWLVMGPSSGWSEKNREKVKDRWVYSPSPPGGFHALLLAHIAASKVR